MSSSVTTGNALISAPAGTPSCWVTCSTVVAPACRPSRARPSAPAAPRRAAACRSRPRRWPRTRSRQCDLVLAGCAGGHVLVRADAAHHPHVRLDRVPLEPAAIEDLVVRTGEDLVLRVEARAVAIEGVRVLHDELARAEDAGARPHLVALLRLEVVEDQRQVAVRADLACDVERHRLLVRHREHQLGALAVVQLEHLGDAVAAGLLPQLGRRDDRHQHLLGADRVELLADDLLDLAMGAPAGRQVAPHAGTDLADHPGADEQLVGDRLGVGGSVLDGGKEVLGEERHLGAKPSWRRVPAARQRGTAAPASRRGNGRAWIRRRAGATRSAARG